MTHDDAKTEAAKLVHARLSQWYYADDAIADIAAALVAAEQRGLREAIAELQSRAIEGAADKFHWCRAVAAIEGLLIRAKFTCPDCGANRVGGDKWCWNCKRSWPTEQPPAPTTDNPDWEELCKEEAHLRDEAETKVAEQAKEIAALRAALSRVAKNRPCNCGGQEKYPCLTCTAKAALSKEPA